VYVVSAQDVSHFCLTRAIAAGELKIDECGGDVLDRSSYNGHSYSNKAPGMSLLAVPSAEAIRLRNAPSWNNVADPRLWGVRVLTSGIAFLLCVFLVGRVAEGIAPGTGGATLVAFGLGTLSFAFAASGFDHDLTAVAGFGAFVLAWARRPGLAGLAGGAAYLLEYEAAAVILLVALYVLLGGTRSLARYCRRCRSRHRAQCRLQLGCVRIAGTQPTHLRGESVPGRQPDSGVLGIHFPSAHGIRLVFVGDRGLLVVWPVVVAATIGLWLLWRRGFRAEAIVAALVTAAFVVGDCGFGDPYGGLSPGPRYLTPALPFLALGLAPAFARWRLPTAALTAVSLVAGMTVGLTWAASASSHYRETVWGELVRVVSQRTDSRLYGDLAKNLLTWAGPTAGVAADAVCACAAAAYVVALARPEQS